MKNKPSAAWWLVEGVEGEKDVVAPAIGHRRRRRVASARRPWRRIRRRERAATAMTSCSFEDGRTREGISEGGGSGQVVGLGEQVATAMRRERECRVRERSQRECERRGSGQFGD